MKKLATFLLVIYSAGGQRFQQDVQDDGQYRRPDDEGQYIEDNSGQYVPDYSGLYQDDGTGRYVQDKAGQYTQSHDKYQFQRQLPKSNYAAATSLKNQFIEPKETEEKQQKPPVSNAIPTPTDRFGKYDDNRWKIIKLFSDVKNNGFHWEYETENEISGQEEARIFNGGTKDEALRTKGFYQYTGADNKVYNVEYTADENGFVPRGNHLHPVLQKAILENLKRNAE